MERDTLIGFIVVLLAVSLTTYLLFLARHIINKIDQKGPGTARKLSKDINGS